MRLVATRRVPKAALLGRDVPDPRGGRIPLLRAGVELSTRRCNALIAAGINAVYVEDELSAGIEVPEILTERTKRETSNALESAFKEAPRLLSSGKPINDRTVDRLQQVAGKIAAEVAVSEDAVVALSDLRGADVYTVQHSVDVAVLGLLLGQRLLRDPERLGMRMKRTRAATEDYLTKLGVGLMLHDIGKLAVPRSILNKAGPLTPAEWEVMNRHPQIGYEMLQGGLIGPLAKSVVRSHHERWDGKGYPQGRAGQSIPAFARIAKVADVFDAITSERPYARAAPQHVGVGFILGGAGTAFDPVVVETFRKLVAPYPPGAEIVLADGRRGVVVSVPDDNVELPLVRIGYDARGNRVDPEEIALTAYPELMPAPSLAA